jgi:alpha,alpha-trehalase
MLVRYGYTSRARELAYMIGKLILNDAKSNGSLHEDYNADTGAPLAPDAKQSGGTFKGFVGWDLLSVDMLHGAVTGKWMMLKINSNQ